MNLTIRCERDLEYFFLHNQMFILITANSATFNKPNIPVSP